MIRSRFGLSIGILVAVIIAAAGGWWIGDSSWQRQALTHELEMTAMCAGGLKLLKEERQEDLSVLLDQRLDSAIKTSTELVRNGATLPPTTPSLLDSARRAAEYYETVGDAANQQAAQSLYAQLTNSK